MIWRINDLVTSISKVQQCVLTSSCKRDSLWTANGLFLKESSQFRFPAMSAVPEWPEEFVRARLSAARRATTWCGCSTSSSTSSTTQKQKRKVRPFSRVQIQGLPAISEFAQCSICSMSVNDWLKMATWGDNVKYAWKGLLYGGSTGLKNSLYNILPKLA